MAVMGVMAVGDQMMKYQQQPLIAIRRAHPPTQANANAVPLLLWINNRTVIDLFSYFT